MINELNLFLGKIWQTKNKSLCFQIKDQKIDHKIFLVFNANSKSKFLSLKKEKSSNILIQGNLSTLLRKHLEGKIISHVFSDNIEDTWILLKHRGREAQTTHYLRVSLKESPELSLITFDKKILFRFSRKGIYTHIKEFSEEFPNTKNPIYRPIYNSLKDELSSEKTETTAPKETDLSPNKELKKALKRRLKTLKSSLEKTRKQNISNEALLKERQDLSHLQENLYLIPHGSCNTILKKEDTGLEEDLIFTLDPSLSPGKNLSQLFQNLSKKEKAKEHASQRLKVLEADLKDIEKDIETIEASEVTDLEKEQLLLRYKIKKQDKISTHKEKKASSPYKTFKDLNNVLFFVGKSATDNDLLVKKAKSNDLWFHALGIRGSHVIVPNSSIRNKKNLEGIKRFGSILALYYSKAKEDQRGEVSFSKRQFLKKDKGQAPGLWSLLKSESIFTSYTEEELKEVLTQMIS